MAADEDRWFNDDEDVPVSTAPAFDGVVALVQDVIARPHDRAAQDRLDFALQAQAEIWWNVSCEEDEPDIIAQCLRVVLLEMVRRVDDARTEGYTS
jgi:hypothetical protein